jgi:hypothetical protein
MSRGSCADLVHGCGPHPILAEDFCGTAAVSRRWVADAQRLAQGGELPPGLLAVAADLDGETLDKARALADDEGVAAGIGFTRTDVLKGAVSRARTGPHAPQGEDRRPLHDRSPHALSPAHAIFVGNFSIGYIHDRATLVSYLARCRKRLDAVNHGFGCSEAEEGVGGAFVCDTYGGPGAFRLGSLQRKHPSRGARDHPLPLAPRRGRPRHRHGHQLHLLPHRARRRDHRRPPQRLHLPLAPLEPARTPRRHAPGRFKRMEVYRDVNLAPGQTPTPAPPPPPSKT